MKAAFVLDQFADTSACTDAQRAKLSFVPSPNGPVAIFAAGTVIEGDEAIMRCKTGQASPLDDECRNAVGLTESQLATSQIEYKMNTLGINDKADRELYKAGVILGYDDKLEYIHGPNWEAYQVAKAETQEEEI